MKVLPFGNYQPDERKGEVTATVFHFTDLKGETFVTYAAVHTSYSGDSAGIDRGYDSLVDAEVAAYLTARRYNAVFVPAAREGRS